VQISIYNLKGQKVRTLLAENMEKGSHLIYWNGKNRIGQKVKPGVYFYKLDFNGKEVARKMVVK